MPGVRCEPARPARAIRGQHHVRPLRCEMSLEFSDALRTGSGVDRCPFAERGLLYAKDFDPKIADRRHHRRIDQRDLLLVR